MKLFFQSWFCTSVYTAWFLFCSPPAPPPALHIIFYIVGHMKVHKMDQTIRSSNSLGHPWNTFKKRLCPSAPRSRSTYIYMKSTTVPRRNWDSPNPSLASECPSPRTGGGAHSPAGEGLGESQFRRLEKKLSTLPTLCPRLKRIYVYTKIQTRHVLVVLALFCGRFM